MDEQGSRNNKQKKDDEKKAKVNPVHPGDTRGHSRRHLLDTCE